MDPKLNGQRFGRLVAGDAIRRPGKWYIQCKCDCGNEKLIRCDHLKAGLSTSCGCYAREVTIASNTKHGDCRKTKHAPEFDVWVSMRERCGNPKDVSYHRYGGRGIKVCKEWQESYPSFLAHVGRRPSSEHSIERINNDGDYEPNNVRWATKVEQCNNRRTNHFLEFNGKRLTLAQWQREVGIHSLTIRRRIVSGWSVEKALTTPVI